MTDCEIASVYRTKEVVARKEHRCCECSAPILSGERHLYIFGKWDFGVNTYRQHLICAEACELIRDRFADECIAFGSLMEEFEEMLRWQYDREADRHKEPWIRLRGLLARIKRRERGPK